MSWSDDMTAVDTLTLIRSAKRDLDYAAGRVRSFLAYEMELRAVLFELERRAEKETER